MHHEGVSYEAPQGDFQYFSVVASLRAGHGWGVGSNKGRVYCITFERKLAGEELRQGYYATKCLEHMEVRIARLESDGWKILRKSWENNDKS